MQTDASLLCQPRPKVDVTQRGVNLRYLLEIMELNVVSASWTIQEVVDKVVVPKTAATVCCLFDMIPMHYAARPHFFVSHTWSRKYGDLMSMLKTYFGVSASTDAAAGVVLWLDIIAINQHPYKDDHGCLQNEDVDSLAKVVHATERTLLCLDKECVALSRIWCVYEVWQTILEKGAYGLRVIMPEVEGSTLTEIFKTFDVMKAEATQKQDKCDILARIDKSSGGAVRLNMQLKCALVDSARHEADHTAATGREQVGLLIKAGDILMADGQHTDAESFYRRALINAEVLGANNPDTLRQCVSCLRRCLAAQGNVYEATIIDIEDHLTRFMPGSRGWVFAMYAEWLHGAAFGHERAFIVYGDAGFGKSTIAAKLAFMRPEETHILAYHFCKHSDIKYVCILGFLLV